MKSKLSSDQRTRRRQHAATLLEVTFSVAIICLLFVSLYGGMARGFAFTELARENLRGTQIILERAEGLRLYNWDQLVYSNVIPCAFTNFYDPLAANTESQGIAYYGTMVVADLDPNLISAPSYATNMRMVTISITWTNAQVPHTRTVVTYVAKNGVQNYVYNH